uniref:F-box-like family protein n=1 Tax=Pithovirus LCPAC001 TaxID=2506585 RepID=A0A481Z2K6_9VIRU|nr:MAG: F-box-like family protein [Pithovirus LCPAC001]
MSKKRYNKSKKDVPFVLLSRDMLWKIMLEMDVQDVVSTCISHKSISHGCTEKFWELYVRKNFKFTGANKFKTWYEMATNEPEISSTTELKTLHLKRNITNIKKIIEDSDYLENIGNSRKNFTYDGVTLDLIIPSLKKYIYTEAAKQFKKILEEDGVQNPIKLSEAMNQNILVLNIL